MRLLVVSALLLVPAIASANAPGDYYDEDGGNGSTSAPGETNPTVAPPAPPPPPSCPAELHHRGREQRLSIGFNVGAMSLAPPDLSLGEPMDFNITELALRYRPGAHLEVEFSLGGGRQQLSDGSKGNLAMGNGTLALRYRFSPHATWNWWVLGGIGRTIIAAHDASKGELDAAEKSHAMLGLGLERRFNHFALQTELRWVGIDGPDATPVVGKSGQSDDWQAASTQGKLDGGQFTLGLSYYF